MGNSILIMIFIFVAVVSFLFMTLALLGIYPRHKNIISAPNDEVDNIVHDTEHEWSLLQSEIDRIISRSQRRIRR